MAIIAAEYAHFYENMKFDDVILSKDRQGRIIVRRRPYHTNYPNTPKQAANNLRFRIANQLATKLAPLYRANYLVRVHEINRLEHRKITPRNLFIKHLMEEVIAINPKTGEIVVDHAKIRLTPRES